MSLKKPLNYKQYLFATKRFYEIPVVKASTSLIIILLIISLLGIFAIKPTLVTISKLIKELKDKTEVNRVLDIKIGALTRAQKAYALIANDLPLVDAAIPKNPDFHTAAKRINFLVYKYNLVLTDASFGDFEFNHENITNSEVASKYITFELSLEGSYLNLRNFLKDLENLDRIIQIESTSFSAKTSVVKNKIQLEATGKFFWQPETSINQKEGTP